MATSTIIACDRCKQTMESEYSDWVCLEIRAETGSYIRKISGNGNTIDLCDQCEQFFVEWMRQGNPGP